MGKVEYINYYSNILKRDIQIEVTGHWGFPILMFPTSGGSVIQNRDFGLNGSVSHLIDAGKIKLYNIETIDNESFYAKGISTQHKIYNYNLYVQFLEKEIIPYLQKIHSIARIGTAGCSFGGYHAANLAFRNPNKFSHLFSMSGAFNIRNFTGSLQDDTVYYNCPNEFVPNDDAWKYNHMNIILGTADGDICKPHNIEMSNILKQKNIDHWYDEKKWARHDWPLWNQMFPEYLNKFF